MAPFIFTICNKNGYKPHPQLSALLFKLPRFYEESTSINKAKSLNSHEMVAEKRKSTQKQKYNKLYKGVFQCSRAYGLKIFF